jgi:phospholipid/cholesterol/gamma-HCH transport system substrate-binding protein
MGRHCQAVVLRLNIGFTVWLLQRERVISPGPKYESGGKKSMPNKKQVSLAQLKVGIFVTVALFLLAVLILEQSWGVDWFSSSAKVITYLPDVGGLKPGAPVWLAGIEIGRVRKVTIVPPEIYAGNEPVFRNIADNKKQIDSIDPKLPNSKEMISDLEDRIRDLKLQIRIVEVQLDIRMQFLTRISRDSEVSIESRGLIGDSYIEISPGSYGVPPTRRGDFYLIESIQRPGFREIMTGANDVMANLGVLSDQIKNIAIRIDPGKVGTGMAETIKDMQDALRHADQAFSSATLLIDDLRKGEGTFGKFVSDPVVYRRLADSLEKFNQIAEKIQNGSGTFSKLINDPDLYDKANATLKKADVMMDRIEKGEGTLGRLSKDPQLYDSTKQAIDRFSSLIDQIDKGNGTLGKLLKDPGLYNNLDQSTAEITKLIYDLRKDPQKYLTIHFRLF